jgi:hypothetical protein
MTRDDIPLDWHLQRIGYDPACGCKEEQWETPKGCLNLHVSADQVVLECWIGDTFDEDDTFAMLSSPSTSRFAAYQTLLGRIDERWT